MARRDQRDLDAEARAAGFPGGRAEREAFRKAAKAAAAKGAPAPKPPTEKAKYKPLPPGAPGGRGRKAPVPPASRAKDVWHALGSGGRTKTTGSAAKALSAIKGAARKGESVYLSVKGNVTRGYEVRPSDQGEATLKGYDPQEILSAIEEFGVKGGISHLLESEGYDKVEQITQFTIRAYN
jgi:hypothetical protein